MNQLRSWILTAALLGLAWDVNGLAGQVPVLWTVLYLTAAVGWMAWCQSRSHNGLTLFYGAFAVVTGARILALASDERWAGAFLNAIIILFLVDFVKARREAL